MPSKIQKLYTINLLAALAVGITILIYWLLCVLSIIQIDGKFVLLGVLVIFSFFLPLNLFLWYQNIDYKKLKVPDFMPLKFVNLLSITMTTIFIIVFAYGYFVYPESINSVGNFYTDRNGARYSYAQFTNFQKWGITFVTTWNIVFLQSLVFLPVFKEINKTWWLEGKK